MSLEDALPLADALLYEGYALYPYRATSPKNRVRFPFGCAYPAAYARAQTGFDRSLLATECLVLSAPTAVLHVCLRCLVLPRADPSRPHAWQPAEEKRLDRELGLEVGTVELPFVLGAVPGVLRVTRGEPAPGVTKLRVEVENRSELAVLEREAALTETLLSVNLLLNLTGAEFVSRLEPPATLAALNAECESQGLHPVLVGRAGTADALLASPIILYDYPELAAASPGDLFDGTEIDEILSLRIQTLTEAEKQAMSALEPRVAQLLARTESLDPERLAGLHGKLAPAPDAAPAPPARHWTPGTRVRLRPKRRADIFDLALDGRLATVRSVECDAEDRVYLCVTVDDDPGADLGLEGQPGHRFFFQPDEVEAHVEAGQP